MKEHHVTIGIVNPKSASNVGAVMRAAGCYRADAIFYTGTRYDRAVKLNTDTKDRRQTIPLTQVDDLLAAVTDDTKIVCVELVEGATSLPNYSHPGKALYIFGPEDGTISQDIIDKADAVVYVPTVGCMNLAGSVNVVLYDRLAKSGINMAGDIEPALGSSQRASDSTPIISPVSRSNCG